MKRAPLVLACLFIQPGGAYGPAPCEARVQLLRQQQSLLISGHCRSMLAAPARYRYQLLVKRQGSSGQSQNSQGGWFSLAANQDTELSRVQLNTASNDHCAVQLVVFDEAGQVVAQDSAHL